MIDLKRLNAPYGAQCFLTARRVVPPVTRGNAMSDRQWSKSTSPTSKHEARISDFSLRLLASPRTACGAGVAPEIVFLIGVPPDHNTLYL